MNTKAETVEQFLQRGGKIRVLAASDSTRKRIQKLSRLQAKMLRENQKEKAEAIKAGIDKLKRALG